MGADEFFRMYALEVRAAMRIARQYGVNKYELNALASIAAWQNITKGRSYTQWEKWTGVSFQVRLKLRGYVRGCISHGLLLELGNYRGQEGTRSLALTQKGVNVLDQYYSVLEGLERETKVKGSGYKDLGIDANDVAELLPDYTLMSNPDNTYKYQPKNKSPD